MSPTISRKFIGSRQRFGGRRPAVIGTVVPLLLLGLCFLCFPLVIQGQQPALRGNTAHADNHNPHDDRHRQLPETRIVGGTLARENYPFFMEWVNRCGGSLIHDDIALSAAHCNGREESLDDPFARRVYLGGRRRTTGVARNMAKRIPHPQWDPSLMSNIEWDFLVIKLNETIRDVPIPGTDLTLETIGLNTDVNYPVGGEDVRAIGYGRLVSGGRELPDMLREVDIEVFSDQQCGTYYGDTRITFEQESMMCAGVDRGGKGTCQGDSGGPLINRDEMGNYRQLGVVSWGEGCGARDYPGVYARVSAVQDWIEEQICRWSCYPPDSCDPAIINDCAKPNLDGRVNLTVRVVHDAYPSETAIIFEHEETATEYFFQDYRSYPVDDYPVQKNLEIPIVVEVNVVNGRNGTYHFTIADSARDGICCGDNGAGNITILNSDTDDVIFFNDNFTEKMQFWFEVDNEGNVLWDDSKFGADPDDGTEDDDFDGGGGDGDGSGSGGDYDPEAFDPEWPGSFPDADATHEVHLNIRYDDFPSETDWFFEQMLPTNPDVVFARSNVTRDGAEWLLVDSKDKEIGLGPRTFMSIPQNDLLSNTLYRFRITDLTWDGFGDGMCCGRTGNGWVTITNGTRTTEGSIAGTVVWGMVGNEFTKELEAHFWVDPNGRSEFVDVVKGHLEAPGDPVPGLSPGVGNSDIDSELLSPNNGTGSSVGGGGGGTESVTIEGSSVGELVDIPVIEGERAHGGLMIQGEWFP